MPASTLAAFLADLERRGELRRVGETVSPLLDVTRLAQEESLAEAPTASDAASTLDPGRERIGGRAILCEQVEGCDMPLCINVFGSYHRMELALGSDFTAIADRIAALVQPTPPRGLREIIGAARRMWPLLRMTPRRRRGRGACQQVVLRSERGEVDCTRLPLIKCWPHDGDPRAVGIDVSPEEARTAGGDGRYITFAGMHTIHADDADERRPGSHNVGMYRAQLLSPTTLAMHWHLHHDGARHWRSWKAAGRPMPIAICLGGPPHLPWAATAPLPPGMSELLMAGFIAGRGVNLVRGVSVPLWVPAQSEIVIEGFVDTNCGSPGWDPGGDEPLGEGAVLEGPFGDHTGFYSMPDRYPVMTVTAITHKRDPVFPATVVGPPPQEDYYLGKATERIFLPLLQIMVPDIVDYHLPRFGAFHNCAFIKIDKAYAQQARRVMHAIWGAGQMAWTKMIVVVDGDVDVHDEQAVLAAVAREVDVQRDLERVTGPLDILDHAAPWLGSGGKFGIDATAKIAGEEGPRGIARPMAPAREAVAQGVELIAGRAGIVEVALPVASGRVVFVSVKKQDAGGAHFSPPGGSFPSPTAGMCVP